MSDRGSLLGRRIRVQVQIAVAFRDNGVAADGGPAGDEELTAEARRGLSQRNVVVLDIFRRVHIEKIDPHLSALQRSGVLNDQ